MGNDVGVIVGLMMSCWFPIHRTIHEIADPMQVPVRDGVPLRPLTKVWPMLYCAMDSRKMAESRGFEPLIRCDPYNDLANR